MNYKAKICRLKDFLGIGIPTIVKDLNVPESPTDWTDADNEKVFKYLRTIYDCIMFD